MKTLPGRVARDFGALASSPIALTVCALFAIGAVSLVAAFPKEHPGGPTAEASSAPPLTAEQRSQIARWWDMQPKVDVPVAANGARVVMVKFSDYQCPGCGATYTAYAPVIAKWTKTGRFQFVLEDYPLEPECNATVHSVVHGASCEAAAAVEMARQRHDGSDARLESWLFTHQEPMLSPDDVVNAAREIAGIQDFAAEYRQALVHVRRAAEMGAALRISRTPTFFINGRRLEGGQDPRVIDAVIELEMARGN
jgi:protein-disulfide isomerase